MFLAIAKNILGLTNQILHFYQIHFFTSTIEFGIQYSSVNFLRLKIRIVSS